MKTAIFVSENFNPSEEGVEVGIVSGLNKNKHTHEYRVFDLKNHVPGVGLIGVKDHDVFALKFKANFDDDFAYAIYLDGVNVIQSYGLKSLSSIPENKRDNYGYHPNFISRKHGQKFLYIDRFSQENLENRYFTFTMGENTGINEILISDPSLEHRIEVYFWKERIIQINQEAYFNIVADESSVLKKSKIGAGESSYKEYKTATTGLNNPEFIGKVQFIHLPAEKLNHLGETLVPINLVDPMDLVPRT